jgi:hypothetical protein
MSQNRPIAQCEVLFVHPGSHPLPHPGGWNQGYHPHRYLVSSWFLVFSFWFLVGNQKTKNAKPGTESDLFLIFQNFQ